MLPQLAVTDPSEIQKNLIKQLTAPVKWTQSIMQMVADGATLFTEVGPGNVLQGLVKKINRESNCRWIINIKFTICHFKHI